MILPTPLPFKRHLPLHHPPRFEILVLDFKRETIIDSRQVGRVNRLLQFLPHLDVLAGRDVGRGCYIPLPIFLVGLFVPRHGGGDGLVHVLGIVGVFEQKLIPQLERDLFVK